MKIKSDRKSKDKLKALKKLIQGSRASMTFLPENQEVVFDPAVGLSVLQVGLLANIPIGHSCGGNGTCTTCRVLVESSLEAMPEAMQTRNELEAEMARERGFEPQERLGCQLLAYNGLCVRRPNAAEPSATADDDEDEDAVDEVDV